MFLLLLLSYTPYFLPIFVIFHLAYYNWFHPLAKFPGPFWASQTNAWKAYQLWTRRMPVTLQTLHDRYGPIVRIGPNDLNFASEDAVATIYKSGRAMPKSSFYDGFTTFQANLFGTRDEDLHALRRRQMSHGFSAASLKGMEGIFDYHISELRKRIEEYAVSGEQFNLKELIAFYAYDIIGELAFSRDFGTQRSGNPINLPPINDHIFLGCMYGMLPNLLPYSMRLTKYVPFPYIQKMLKSRLWLRNTTAECVGDEMARSKDPQRDTEKNLLTQLINAKDPETGAGLTHADVASEAFGFLVAGSHTTSGTLTLLFYHLLHDPEAAARLTKELDDQLGLLNSGGNYNYQTLDTTLPYTRACIQENYRITPVFTMPLPRVVSDPAGVTIASQHIPTGSNVSMVSYCLHHNASIWGLDHNAFDPSRWLPSEHSSDEKPRAKADVNNIMPFGAGHRTCIGRNIAAMSVMKVLVTLWRNYEISVVDEHEKLVVESVGIDEKEGPLMCRVKKR